MNERDNLDARTYPELDTDTVTVRLDADGNYLVTGGRPVPSNAADPFETDAACLGDVIAARLRPAPRCAVGGCDELPAIGCYWYGEDVPVFVFCRTHGATMVDKAAAAAGVRT